MPFPPPREVVDGSTSSTARRSWDWLEQTGRGNNPQARTDVAAFAGPGCSARPDRTSTTR